VRVENLPGNLKRYNGMNGVIESVEFDSDHRQWINLKLEDNVRTLPIRVPKKCVTVASRPNTNVSDQVSAPSTAVPEKSGESATGV
jgi:hypothetical protein